MAAFPLNDRISSLDVEHEELTIKTTMENGTVTVRPRYTKERLKFSVVMTPLIATEFSLLQEFYNAHKTYAQFGFTDPSTGMTYTVRFNSPLKYKKTAKGLILVDVSVDLVEI